MSTFSQRPMLRRLVGAFAAATAAVLGHAALVEAHVGVVNTQLPYAVAGKTYELVLAVPHGCTLPGTTPAEHADTKSVEVTVPAAFVSAGAPRPLLDGVFGKPTRRTEKDANNADVVVFTWTKPEGLDSTADDQAYRVGVRVSVPAAPFTSVRFPVRQFCTNPNGGEPIVLDWANYVGSDGSTTNEAPRVKIFPARAPGWNKFQLASTNEKHTQAAVTALMTDFFSEAQIVWLKPGTNDGTGGWSANASTLERIKSLVEASEAGKYYELSSEAGVMIHASDEIWAKF